MGLAMQKTLLILRRSFVCFLKVEKCCLAVKQRGLFIPVGVFLHREKKEGVGVVDNYCDTYEGSGSERRRF